MHKSRAYTLIEILIALLIFTVVATLTATGLNNILKTRSYLKSHDDDLQRLQIAMTIMQNDIEQAINRDYTNNAGVKSGALNYDTQMRQLSFNRGGYINPTNTLPRSYLQHVVYQLQNNQLYRVAYPYVDVTPATPSYRRRLFDKVKAVNWTFYSAPDKQYQIWPPVDALRNELPRAIWLEIVFQNDTTINRFFSLDNEDIEYEFLNP